MTRIFKVSHLINFAVLFILFYLTYHTINGQYNIQNYLINKFEQRMYEDFRYKLKQDAVAVNLDILALRNGKADILDEIQKRNNPTPRDGEIVIKID